ncbi:MAG: methylated-DNA--[protein]-cysteine S-methyltransferase [Pseudomonadota bacterium]
MSYQCFETAFGYCAIAWSDIGLTRVVIAEPSRARIERRMEALGEHLTTDPLPKFAAQAMDDLVAYFMGAPLAHETQPLDWSQQSSFRTAIYKELLRVPRGATISYGALAAKAGRPSAARAVGVAMGENPWPILVPCHRVLASDGDVGGFSAAGGIKTKRKLLRIEGVEFPSPVIHDLFDSMAGDDYEL